MEALLHTLRHLTPIAQGLCVLLLGLYAFSGVRFVGPQESALVLRLGKLQPKVHGPGLLLAWPRPLDEVVLVPTGAEHILALDSWLSRGPRLEQGRHTRPPTAEEKAAGKYLIGNQEMPVEVVPVGDSLDPVADGYTLTGDWNVVQGRFSLRYRVADPVARFRFGEDIAPLLRRLSYRALTAALSAVPISRALTDGRAELAEKVRGEIDREVRELNLGLAVTAFEVREIAPPRQVAAAFEEVTSARLFAKTLVETAESYRGQQVTLATGQSAAIRQRAEGFAAQLVASSQGEAEAFRQFHAEYARSPDLVRDRIYTETLGFVMQQVHSSTVLPPSEAPPSVLLEPSTTP